MGARRTLECVLWASAPSRRALDFRTRDRTVTRVAPAAQRTACRRAWRSDRGQPSLPAASGPANVLSTGCRLKGGVWGRGAKCKANCNDTVFETNFPAKQVAEVYTSRRALTSYLLSLHKADAWQPWGRTSSSRGRLTCRRCLRCALHSHTDRYSPNLGAAGALIPFASARRPLL